MFYLKVKRTETRSPLPLPAQALQKQAPENKCVEQFFTLPPSSHPNCPLAPPLPPPPDYLLLPLSLPELPLLLLLPCSILLAIAKLCLSVETTQLQFIIAIIISYIGSQLFIFVNTFRNVASHHS